MIVVENWEKPNILNLNKYSLFSINNQSKRLVTQSHKLTKNKLVF